MDHIFVSSPSTMEDCKEIVEYLWGGSLVIANVAGIDTLQAQRVVDYLFGACHILDGQVFTIARGLYGFAPSNVVYLDVDERVHDRKASVINY